MKLELEVYRCLCATEIFTINGVSADSSDFGEQFDRNTEEAEPYSCGNMKFSRKEIDQEILVKYSINENEYNEIATELEEKLSFGSCGWCS